MFKNAKNSKVQGDIGLSSAIKTFSMLGATISVPLTDSQDYDLIVDIDGKINRVQVKTTSFKQNNNYSVHLTVQGGNRSWNGVRKKLKEDAVELLYVLTSDGKEYIFPWKEVCSKSSISLGYRCIDHIVNADKNIEDYNKPLRDLHIKKDKIIKKPRQKAKFELICEFCNNKYIGFKNSKYCSQNCFNLMKRKPNRPSKEELENLIWKIPMTKLAKQYGVSDKAVKKWCEQYNIAEFPGRGYWAKNKN